MDEIRANRFSYKPDDTIEVVDEAGLAAMGISPISQESGSAQAARTAVRRALGDAAHAMSDQEVDAVIAAAREDDGDGLLDSDPEDDALTPGEQHEITALLDEFGVADD